MTTIPDRLRCPKCNQSMESVPAGFGQRVHRCENCRGIFCTETALDSIERAWFNWPDAHTEKTIDTGHKAAGRYFDARGQIDCPACGTRMEDLAVPEQPHIWFERCPQCKSAFFDAGELTDLRYKTIADWVRDLLKPSRDSE